MRVPAAWNDLVGLKTSHGALPMAGVVPLCPRFDTAGPLARTVEDAALLWSVLSGGPAPDLTGARLDETRLLVLDPAVPAFPAVAAAAAELGAEIWAERPPALDLGRLDIRGATGRGRRRLAEWLTDGAVTGPPGLG